MYIWIRNDNTGSWMKFVYGSGIIILDPEWNSYMDPELLYWILNEIQIWIGNDYTGSWMKFIYGSGIIISDAERNSYIAPELLYRILNEIHIWIRNYYTGSWMKLYIDWNDYTGIRSGCTISCVGDHLEPGCKTTLLPAISDSVLHTRNGSCGGSGIN